MAETVTHAPRVTEMAIRAAEAQLPAVREAQDAAARSRGRPLSYPPALAAALMAVRRAVQPVAKEGLNAFHGYKYPKAEDVVDEVIPLLAEAGLFIVQSEVSRTLFQEERTLAVTYEYIIFNGNGDVWPDRPQRTGLGMVRDGKGTVDDKAANKASTQSEKYFYIKFFGIRTSDAAQTDNDSGQPNGGQASTPSPGADRRPSGASLEPPDPSEPPQSSGGSRPSAEPRREPPRPIEPPEPDVTGDMPPDPTEPDPTPRNGVPNDPPAGEQAAPEPVGVEEIDPDTGEITMRLETRPGYQLSTGGIPAGATVKTVVAPVRPTVPGRLPPGTVVTAKDLAEQDADATDIPAFLARPKVKPNEAKPPEAADKPLCHPMAFWITRTKKGFGKFRYCSVCNEGEAAIQRQEAEKVSEVTKAPDFDEAQWLRDVEGAALGCTTAAELDEIQQKVLLPQKLVVSQPAWTKARKIIATNAKRIFEEDA
jgi:hypothetical protein